MTSPWVHRLQRSLKFLKFGTTYYLGICRNSIARVQDTLKQRGLLTAVVQAQCSGTVNCA